MTSHMTERFSAPGATLVKLFGRPAEEVEEFGRRASRVRDIGVRSALAMEVFFRALGLVSGLALALIYGLGGYLALQGDLEPRSDEQTSELQSLMRFSYAVFCLKKKNT